MKKIDKDGLILSDIQGTIFEKPLEHASSSSEIFIRRFMNSNISRDFDSTSFLNGSLSLEDVFDSINEQYGNIAYGKTRFGKEALYWIGYIYRYFAYTYNLTSKQVYNIIKPKELAKRYYVYHTFDCAFAIERILEEKGISFEDPNKRLLEFIKKKKYEENTVLNYPKRRGYKSKKELKVELLYKDKIIGTLSFKKLNNLETSLSDENSNNSLLKEVAISKAIDFAKDILKVDHLDIKECKDNEENIKMLTKAGFLYQSEDKDNVSLTKRL